MALWWLSHVLIGAEQISQSNGFVAVWARASGADPTAELVAVRAVLLAQETCAAGRALVDGLRPWYAGREVGQLWGMAAPPGGLAAGGGAVALTADRGERSGAPRARYRHAIVTARGFSHRAPPGSAQRSTDGVPRRRRTVGEGGEAARARSRQPRGSSGAAARRLVGRAPSHDQSRPRACRRGCQASGPAPSATTHLAPARRGEPCVDDPY
jgi:hypothetical protein